MYGVPRAIAALPFLCLATLHSHSSKHLSVVVCFDLFSLLFFFFLFFLFFSLTILVVWLVLLCFRTRYACTSLVLYLDQMRLFGFLCFTVVRDHIIKNFVSL